MTERHGFLSSVVPVVTVLFVIGVVWLVATVVLNTPWQKDVYKRADRTDVGLVEFIGATMTQERPVLPSPQQVAVELYNTTVKKKITSKRSLLFHSKITLSSALLGFVMGTLLGIVLSVGITYNQALNKSLMPWIITSQTIPILAIAPMVIVVLNSIGVQGLVPKAFISMYLSFFPIAVGMVKGLNSPDISHLDLMHTYSASKWQSFWKLRLPSSLPYLFTSMKIAVAISIVGAIVAELPTGAVAGLGARLLAGSYYGQTVQIWSALVMASILAASLVGLVGLAGHWVTRRMGLQHA
ncbi:MAG: ABC transporter permease [Gammaproteobacteria bacterium]|nr:ABC transporter permease [Gammaproteobacteria bacterium]